MPFEKIFSSKFCQGYICTFHKVKTDSSVKFFIKTLQGEFLLKIFAECYELRIFFFKIEVFNLAFYTVFIHLFPIVLNIYSNHKKRKLQGLHVCACEHIFPTFFFSCLEIIYAWNRKEAIGEIVERVLQCHS